MRQLPSCCLVQPSAQTHAGSLGLVVVAAQQLLQASQQVPPLRHGRNTAHTLVKPSLSRCVLCCARALNNLSRCSRRTTDQSHVSTHASAVFAGTHVALDTYSQWPALCKRTQCLHQRCTRLYWLAAPTLCMPPGCNHVHIPCRKGHRLANKKQKRWASMTGAHEVANRLVAVCTDSSICL